MDSENREIQFPTDDDSNSALSSTSMEEARAKMNSNLEHIVGGIARSFNFAHEMANILSPALGNFAKMAQELSAIMNLIVVSVF